VTVPAAIADPTVGAPAPAFTVPSTVEDHGEWRIVSRAFTLELPRDSLPKDC
jgi:hypothetical protein